MSGIAQSVISREAAVLAALPDAVVVTSPTGAIISINAAVTELLGHESNDLVGVSVFEYLHPDDVAGLVASFATTAARGGIHPPVEIRVRTADGCYRALEVRARNTVDDEHLEAIVFVARPTDERNAAHRRLRLLFEQAPAPLAMTLPGSRGVEANAPFAALFGYTREALLSVEWTALVHPDDREELIRDRALLEAGEVTRVHAERQYLRADGSTFYGRSAVSAMRGIDDTIECLLFTIDDITLEVQAREALSRSEGRLRALIDHSPDIVSIVRADGDWEANEQGTRLLGYPKGFDPPGGVLSLVHPDDLERAACALADVFSGSRAPDEPVEIRLRAADGSYRDFECIAIANRISGATRGEDVVARLGGDEFVVVCDTATVAADTEGLADRILQAIREPIDLDAHAVTVGASIGVALLTPRDDAASLLMRADAAAYRAKQLGRGRVELAPE